MFIRPSVHEGDAIVDHDSLFGRGITDLKLLTFEIVVVLKLILRIIDAIELLSLEEG